MYNFLSKKELVNGINLLKENPHQFFRLLFRVMRFRQRPYRRRFRMRLDQWLEYHQKNIAFKECYWMGHRAQKNPMDAWIYQEIIYEVKPEVIVEIGSCEGGSTLYLAHLLDIVGQGKVISVDIDRSKFSVKHDRIIEITGDCSSDEVIKKVAGLCAGKRTLIIHDGDHSESAVYRDLGLYADLVSLGSYLIVEDGIMDLFKPWSVFGTLKPGPLPAIERFIKNNPDFAIDEGRERYLMTYNPKGFLKRIK